MCIHICIYVSGPGSLRRRREGQSVQPAREFTGAEPAAGGRWPVHCAQSPYTNIIPTHIA